MGWVLGVVLAAVLTLGVVVNGPSRAFLLRALRRQRPPVIVRPAPDAPRTLSYDIRVEYDIRTLDQTAQWRVPPVVDVQATLVEMSAMMAIMEQLPSSSRDDFDDFVDRQVLLDTLDEHTAVVVGGIVLDERHGGSLAARRTLMALAVGRVLRQFADEYGVRPRVAAEAPTKRMTAWKRLGSI